MANPINDENCNPTVENFSFETHNPVIENKLSALSVSEENLNSFDSSTTIIPSQKDVEANVRVVETHDDVIDADKIIRRLIDSNKNRLLVDINLSSDSEENGNFQTRSTSEALYKTEYSNEKRYRTGRKNSDSQISTTESVRSTTTMPSSVTRVPLNQNIPTVLQIPIIGYEVMEERARFTIYKLRIEDPRTGLSWMVFRRYTDFLRLYNKLKALHPTINFPFPGKRRFKDNFDPIFLEERLTELQVYVNAVIRNVSTDNIVRDFFCLDEPPPICDAEPESLARFGALEDTVINLKNQIRIKDETIDYLKKKVTYFEDKMRDCPNCSFDYKKTRTRHAKNSASTSSSSCS